MGDVMMMFMTILTGGLAIVCAWLFWKDIQQGDSFYAIIIGFCFVMNVINFIRAITS